MNLVTRQSLTLRWSIWQLLALGVLVAYLPPLTYYGCLRLLGRLPYGVSYVTDHGPWYYGPEVNFIFVFLLVQVFLLPITVVASTMAAIRSHSLKPLLCGGVLLLSQVALFLFADNQWLWTL